MATPSDVLAWIGAIGGLVGAGAGLYGGWMGARGVRRVEEYKTQDLRIGLSKSELTLRDDIRQLPALLEEARRSHRAITSARGMLNSGYMKGWDEAWKADLLESEQLARDPGFLAQGLEQLDQAGLEARTLKVHELERRIRDLTGKYRGVLSKDDENRARLAAEQHAHTMARMKPK